MSNDDATTEPDEFTWTLRLTAPDGSALVLMAEGREDCAAYRAALEIGERATEARGYVAAEPERETA
jgi:hypothetical protein